MRIIEIETTDHEFARRLIDWLNKATTKPSSTVVRLKEVRAEEINADLLAACERLLADLAETACVSVEEFAANSEIGEAALVAIAKATPAGDAPKPPPESVALADAADALRRTKGTTP